MHAGSSGLSGFLTRPHLPRPPIFRTWTIWLALQPHAETLIKHTQTLGMDTLPVGELTKQFAWFLYEQANYMQAEPLMRRALAILEKALGPEHPNAAWSLDGLARIHTDQGQYPNAAALYQRSLAIRERALGLEHPDVAWSLNGLAGLSRLRGELEKAESLFERALEIRENALGIGHPDVATSLKD